MSAEKLPEKAIHLVNRLKALDEAISAASGDFGIDARNQGQTALLRAIECCRDAIWEMPAVVAAAPPVPSQRTKGRNELAGDMARGLVQDPGEEHAEDPPGAIIYSTGEQLDRLRSVAKKTILHYLPNDSAPPQRRIDDASFEWIDKLHAEVERYEDALGHPLGTDTLGAIKHMVNTVLSQRDSIEKLMAKRDALEAKLAAKDARIRGTA